MPVSKCRIYYHSILVRPTDEETTVIEKIVCYSSQKKGQATPQRATQGRTRGRQEAGGGGKVDGKLSHGFGAKE